MPEVAGERLAEARSGSQTLGEKDKRVLQEEQKQTVGRQGVWAMGTPSTSCKLSTRISPLFLATSLGYFSSASLPRGESGALRTWRAREVTGARGPGLPINKTTVGIYYVVVMV